MNIEGFYFLHFQQAIRHYIKELQLVYNLPLVRCSNYNNYNNEQWEPFKISQPSIKNYKNYQSVWLFMVFRNRKLPALSNNFIMVFPHFGH